MADSQRKTANLVNLPTWANTITDARTEFQLMVRLYRNGTNIGQVNYNITQTGYFSAYSVVASVDFDQIFIKHNGTVRDITIIDMPFDGKKNQQIWFSATALGVNPTAVGGLSFKDIMLNLGDSALPYEPYGWLHSLRKLTTATEAVENPLYSDGTAITSYTIKGNTVQNGTPTPSNPVFVQGVGEFDGGQYKIPISSAGVTTNIYLGSTQTTRRIKKLVLTGEENWGIRSGEPSNTFFCGKTDLGITSIEGCGICSHYRYTTGDSFNTLSDGEFIITLSNVGFRDLQISSGNNFKSYLAAQYANGTPVTIWYVLATPETAAVNEPLQKIGTYADTLSNAASIPTTEGANSITVDTTVQPSEFTATWTGWHDSSVKEWDGSDWS